MSGGLSDEKQVNGIAGGGTSTKRYQRGGDHDSGVRRVSGARIKVIC